MIRNQVDTADCVVSSFLLNKKYEVIGTTRNKGEKNLFRLKENIQNKKKLIEVDFDQYFEIGKLVKEARIQQNLSIEELARISRIPEKTIISLENNNKNLIPKYPFIRSIVIKLEECLALKKKYISCINNKRNKNF